MTQPALTRASTMGPVVEFVARGGGCVARVFRRAELPLRLAEQPDLLVPLRDQFRLIECAARELGDDALPARLAREAGVAGLGPWAQRFCAAPSLRRAIETGIGDCALLLQSATHMALTVDGPLARWTYRITERTPVGRQKNELLAMGYMISVLRWYAGASWAPDRLDMPGPRLPGRASVESLNGCDVTHGEVAAVVFPAHLLDVPNPRTGCFRSEDDPTSLPGAEDLVGYVRELVRLSLLDGRPHRAWVARRLGLTVRTLQRRLQAQGTSFADVVRGISRAQAAVLLRRPEASVTEVAYELGYADPAHFTRAFVDWYGQSPQRWRREH